MKNNKNVTLFWYSQTGHSFACAEKAKNVLSEHGYNVTLCSIFSATQESYNSDLFIFTFPVFNFYIPSPLRNFLKNIPAQSVKKKALAIITCAGIPANTAFMTGHMLARKNIKLINHKIIRSRDSFIPFAKWFSLFNLTKKPDEKSLNQVKSFLQKKIINSEKVKLSFFNPLNLFHWIGVIAPINGPKMFLGKRTFLKEDCNNCNLCATLCPSGAITSSGNEINYNDSLCFGCCGCLNICPTNAWRAGFDSKYHNKGINIKKMAKATDRHKQNAAL